MRRYRKPHRIKKKKSILKNRFFWLSILFLIILGEVFYLIFFSPFFQVKVIEISGNEKVSAENLEHLLNIKINQKVLFFPSQSIFLTNFKGIKREILKNFPQVEEAGLKRKLPDTLLLLIRERKPIAIFCFTPQPLEAGDREASCFSIDKHGIIFEPSERKQDFVSLVKKIDAGMEKEISLGEEIVKEELLSKILEVEAKLKNELKIATEEILVVSEANFFARTLEDWQIYFNSREDLDWQLTKLKMVLAEEIPQEKRQDLDYIDVRFGNFAPYKYR